MILTGAGCRQPGELQKVLYNASPISEPQSETTYKEQEALGKRQPTPIYSCSRKGGPDRDSKGTGGWGRHKAATAGGRSATSHYTGQSSSVITCRERPGAPLSDWRPLCTGNPTPHPHQTQPTDRHGHTHVHTVYAEPQ